MKAKKFLKWSVPIPIISLLCAVVAIFFLPAKVPIGEVSPNVSPTLAGTVIYGSKFRIFIIPAVSFLTLISYFTDSERLSGKVLKWQIVGTQVLLLGIEAYMIISWLN